MTYDMSLLSNMDKQLKTMCDMYLFLYSTGSHILSTLRYQHLDINGKQHNMIIYL